jgi:hypothetical protein
MTPTMLEQRDLSTPAIATTPCVFCKGCGYALVGLESSNCPECGRSFDLGNRRTFARRPPRSWVWRWGRRVLAGVLLLLLTAGAGVGWLWWGWRAEQPTIARLRTSYATLKLKSIGPGRLRWVLGERLGYLTERVDAADINVLEAAETEQLDFRSLTQIRRLWLFNCEVSNSNLSHVAGLAKLEDLRMWDLRIEKADLAFLEKLPALCTLYLNGNWVAKDGFEHIGRLKHLKNLDLYGSGMSDTDLEHLQGLASLVELRLDANPITDAGLEHLHGLKSLRVLEIHHALITLLGVAKLKQAIPGLQVN